MGHSLVADLQVIVFIITLVAARYRELERLMAIEQAKELGFDDLETARDLLAPPDLTQAREYVSSRVWCPLRVFADFVDLLLMFRQAHAGGVDRRAQG
jgi:hypothetical protein